MKVTIEHYGNIRSFEIPEDSTIDDVMTEIINLVRSTGYHQKSIRNWIVEYAEEIDDIVE